MTLFVSSYVNKVDQKGRVSVPSSFRAALSGAAWNGIVVFRSSHYPALEGFSWSFMEEVAARLDHFNLFSSEQDDLATAVFGDSVQLPFDGEGRVVMSDDLLKHAGIKDSACFVGMGKKFQIWNPREFEKRRLEARKNVKAKDLTLPRGIAA